MARTSNETGWLMYLVSSQTALPWNQHMVLSTVKGPMRTPDTKPASELAVNALTHVALFLFFR